MAGSSLGATTAVNNASPTPAMSIRNEPVVPLGNKPFWDQKRTEGVKGVSESGVLLQSLKQSRDRWLHKSFPKFSSRSRGNKDPAPPPHTIQMRGKCTLAIGPHIFPNTVFYEVHYLQSYQTSSFSTQPHATDPHWQTSPSHTSTFSLSATAATQGGSATNDKSSEDSSSTSTLNSLPSPIVLTPNLIQQVNAAASSNPILANLLQLAAAGNATQDQLKTLGLLIQSFASLSSTTPLPQPSGYYQGMHGLPPVKEFDLVFEFLETPTERWYIPRVPVYAERKPSPDKPDELDVSLLTCVPFESNPLSQESSQTQEGPSLQYPVAFILKDAPFTVWETVWRWIGGEAKNKTNKVDIESRQTPPRLYLGYRLPPGPLLAQFQAVSAPPYVMKPLKQGASSQSRAPRQKRSKKDGTATGPSKGNDTDTVVVKRARASQLMATPLATIHCLSCKNSDVPLILGGRYCRPCAEIERQKSPSSLTPAAPVLTS